MNPDQSSSGHNNGYDLSVFCGYGNRTVKFLSRRQLVLPDVQTVATDVDCALASIGMHQREILCTIFSALDAQHSFAQGFSFKERDSLGMEITVYVSQYSRMVEECIAAGMKQDPPIGLEDKLQKPDNAQDVKKAVERKELARIWQLLAV